MRNGRNLTFAHAVAAYKMELRLIVLHWTYLLLHVLWAAFVVATYSNSGYQTAQTTLYMMSLGIIPLVSLAAMLLSGMSASRSARTRFDVLEAAYPVGEELIIGRWLGMLTATCGFLIVPLIIALIRGSLESFLQGLPIFLLETITLFALIGAAIWLLQVTIGVKRWVYPLFAVVWLGSAIFPASLNAEVFPISLLLAFTAQGWLNTMTSDLWGRLSLGNLPLFYDLFYLALTALILTLALWRVHRERFNRLSIAAAGVAFVCLIVAFIAARGFSLDVVTAYQQDDQRRQFYGVNGGNLTLPAELPYTVQAYDVTFDITDPALPQFAAQIEIANRGDQPLTQVNFSLNSQLEITESNIPYQREVDFVTFTLPEPLAAGASVALELRYQGVLWYYDGSLMVGRPRAVSSFTHPDGVNLLCAAAWYPIPGWIYVGRTWFLQSLSMTETVERNTPDCVLDEPARFTLRVDHPDSLKVASNLPSVSENEFRAESALWAQIVAAPSLITESDANITLVTSEFMSPFVQPLVMTYYPPTLEHIRRFFPDVEGVDVFVVDSGFIGTYSRVATPETDHRLMVVTSPMYLSAFERNHYNHYEYTVLAMLNSLFGIGDTFWGAGYVENIAYFLWAHHESGGDPNTIQTLTASEIPQDDIGSRVYFSQTPTERYPLAQFLAQWYVEQGEDAVIRLLYTVYENRNMLNTLSTDQAIQWIMERANDV